MADSNLSSQILGDMGVALARFKFGKLNLAFRDQPTLDFGIDAEIELIDGMRPTGRILKLQVKCGRSFFREKTDVGYVYRFEEKHRQYWEQHSVPVLLVLCDHDLEVCYWAHISRENVVSTGDEYKIIVPFENQVDATKREEIADLVTPLIPLSTFEILNEEDVSTGATRRLSYYIRLNAANKVWTKESVRRLILQVTGEARSSEYYRDEIVESVHRGSPPDVVWVFVYTSESHRNKGAYLAKAIWVSSDLSEPLRPSEYRKPETADNVFIEWKDDALEIPVLIDAMRASKGEYMSYVRSHIAETQSAVLDWKYENVSYASVDLENLKIEFEQLVSIWNSRPTPPIQCEDLDQRLSELEISVDNARIYAERLMADFKKPDEYQLKQYLKESRRKLDEIEYEIKRAK